MTLLSVFTIGVTQIWSQLRVAKTLEHKELKIAKPLRQGRSIWMVISSLPEVGSTSDPRRQSIQRTVMVQVNTWTRRIQKTLKVG
jgi:hypothetical protein